jgi:hypothetical protein
MVGGVLDHQIAEAQARLDQINDQIARLKEQAPSATPTMPPGDTTIIPPPPGRHPAYRLTADQKIEEDIHGVRDRTAALKEETATVGLSYEEQEKRRMALDLEQEALKRLRQEAARKGQTDLDAIKLSPEQIAKIDAASDAYARQADELRKVRENQQIAEQAASEFYDTFKSDTIDAITGAKTLGEALDDIGKKLANMLLNNAFDALFKPRSGSSDGGIFGDIFGALGHLIGGFGGGGSGSGDPWFGLRENGGPVEAGRAYIVGEKRPELFVPRTSGMIIPQVPAAGGTTITYAPTIDARGADSAAVARIQETLARDKAEFSARVVKAVQKANKSHVDLGTGRHG